MPIEKSVSAPAVGQARRTARVRSAPFKQRDNAGEIRFRAPGPGEYRAPDSIGPQVVSTKASSPKAVIGSSPQRGKIEGIDSPGPGAYYKYEPPGTATTSTIRSVPRYTIRGREKYGSADTYKTKTPGPGHYSKIFNCRLPQAPAYSCTGRNWYEANPALAPGPGAYRPKSSIGRQVLSTKPSLSAWKIGSSKRKPIITPQGDVGPGDYTTEGGIGKQVNSKHRTAGAVSMKFRRNPPKSMTSVDVGPGSYKLPSTFGRQPVSTIRSSPGVRMSGRTLFGSPYNF